MFVQSAADPWRTKSALVKAANDIVIAKMATQMQLCDAPPAPERWSQLRRGAASERAGKLWMTFFPILTRPGAETLSPPPRIRLAGGRLRRILHDVVAFRTLHIILIGGVGNHGMFAPEIVPGWRRRNTPLERRSVPRVFRGRRTLITAVYQVEDEDELRYARADGRDGDQLV